MRKQLTAAALVFSLAGFHFSPEAGVRNSVGDKLKSLKKVAKNQDW